MSHRIRTLLVVATLVLAATGGSLASAQSADAPSPYEGKFSGAADEMSSPLWGYDTSDVTTYDGRPGIYVTVSDTEDFSTLDSWANATTEREVLATDNGSQRALVAAPAPDIFGGLRFADADVAGQSVPIPSSPTGLVERSYVTKIDPALVVERAEPVDQLASDDETAAPRFSRVATLRGGSFGGAVAHDEDTNESDMAEARASVNASASSTSATGEGARVAVIDTGLNTPSTTNDPLFQDRIDAPRNTITGVNGSDAVATSTDHGPWVAGSIAANPDPGSEGEAYEGVAPNATIIPIKSLSDGGSGNTQDIVEGIQWASQQDADILSMSLGTTVYSATIAEELRDFLDDGGTAVFVAVGNARQRPGHLRYVASPADVPEPGIVSVAATNTTTARNASSAYFSNVGPDSGASDLSNGATNGQQPDLAAPGMNVTATHLDGNDIRRNTTLSGTSMATPVAAGVGALVLDANPGLENESTEFADRLRTTAAPMPRAGVTEVGNGMIDAEAAIADEQPTQQQADALTTTAEARDTANRGYSGSWVVRIALGTPGIGQGQGS